MRLRLDRDRQVKNDFILYFEGKSVPSGHQDRLRVEYSQTVYALFREHSTEVTHATESFVGHTQYHSVLVGDTAHCDRVDRCCFELQSDAGVVDDAE